MPSHDISLYRDDSGGVVGIEITVRESGDQRTVKIGADEDGYLELSGVGPKGERRGKADPNGNGNNPLGK